MGLIWSVVWAVVGFMVGVVVGHVLSERAVRGREELVRQGTNARLVVLTQRLADAKAVVAEVELADLDGA